MKIIPVAEYKAQHWERSFRLEHIMCEQTEDFKGGGGQTDKVTSIETGMTLRQRQEHTTERKKRMRRENAGGVCVTRKRPHGGLCKKDRCANARFARITKRKT